MDDFRCRPQTVTASVCLTPHQLFQLSLSDVARATSPREVEREGLRAMSWFDALILTGQIDRAQASEWAMQIYHKATDTLLLIRQAEQIATEADTDQGGE